MTKENEKESKYSEKDAGKLANEIFGKARFVGGQKPLSEMSIEEGGGVFRVCIRFNTGGAIWVRRFKEISWS